MRRKKPTARSNSKEDERIEDIANTSRSVATERNQALHEDSSSTEISSSNQSELSAPVNRRSLRSLNKVVNQAHQSNGRRTNSQASFASSYKDVTRKRGRPRLSHPIGKISTSKNRGRPRQSEAYTKDDKAKNNVKLSIVKVLRDCSRGSRSYTGAQTGGQIRRTGRKVVPQLTAVAERSQAGKICNLDSASEKHKKRISKRGQDRLQNTAVSGDDGKGVSPDCRSVEENLPKKKVRSEEALRLREQKLAEKAAAKLAKAKERELKKAAKLERRRQKLEEQERKRRERLLRKEMKEKLLQQKREWREEEKRKRLARELQSMCKKRKLDSYLKSCETDETTQFISSPCDGILPFVDLSIFWSIFVPGQVFLGRWLVGLIFITPYYTGKILDEVPSHRYGVIAYLVVEQSEAATQCVLYAQLADSSFASLPEEMYFVQIQSEKNRSSMFQTIVDARFIDASPQSPPFFYAIVLLRESVSLYDLWNGYPHPPEGSSEKKAWSLGTVGRLAADFLGIIEVVYETGYTFRNVEMSQFHLDVRSRRLFLNNASEVVKSTELMDLKMKNGGILLHNYWHGCPEFAPLSWHEKGERSVVRVTDCAEVLFYIMLELMGLMTWRGLNKDEIKLHKLNIDSRVLPVPLVEYWKIVRRAQEMQISKVMLHDGYLLLNGKRGGATSSVLDFRRLFMKLLALYKIFGGVKDDDTPYDFDVVQDPTSREPNQARLVELFKKAHLIREKIGMLKADISALTIRKEYAKRCAAQTRREQAAASARASVLGSELNVAE